MIAAASDPRPSLRRRLLGFLLIPTTCVVMIISAVFYLVALRYSNRIHDNDLKENVLALAKVISTPDSDGTLTTQARQLLEFNTEGRSFFEVRSLRHGVISSSLQHIPTPGVPEAINEPVLSNGHIGTAPIRIATLLIPAPRDADDHLQLSAAETLSDRQLRARDIIMIMLPIELLLSVILFVLVWHGVRVGLRVLDPAIQRLAQSRHKPVPVSGPDIPVEILPFAQTIDGLFQRMQKLVAMQEQFVSDAAHQLRTPLAGLSMHVERAQAMVETRPDEARRTLEHVKLLTLRVARACSQLLALTRAQLPDDQDSRKLLPIDLAQWLPDVVSERIPEAIHADIDLGYAAEDGIHAQILGDRTALQEVIDNLIDNALRHVAQNGSVTVGLAVASSHVIISIDDDGPGVSDDVLPRLGERFFRAPGAPEGGTGLGLAIVKRIAERHHANVVYLHSDQGGLRAEIWIPLQSRNRQHEPDI
ncbi:MAG: sensor histidine kinase N-terminal domain-containing protein [Xanthomonadaceae bacterium]|jgi:two-component system sensor histidine kinase TctE|nr:sensor histidine kinase N-terminal domain-containing protein [Xanthomonadaceae bacterium]